MAYSLTGSSLLNITPKLKVESNDPVGGSVTNIDERYYPNTSLTLIATTNSGYEFNG